MGILVGLFFDIPLKKLMCKHPKYAMLITIALIGTTFQIVDIKTVENVFKHLDKF